MTVSIGVDYTSEHWRIGSIEQGREVEFHSCSTVDELRALLSQICALYPEPTIVVSLDVTAPFSALSTQTDEQVDRLVQWYRPAPASTEIRQVLQLLRWLSSRSYCAPSVEYLPTVPLYRRLMRPALGTAREVCSVITLLHHMCEQEASWPEMNFFVANASESGICLLVVKDGQIINGIGTLQGSSLPVSYGYLATLETDAEASEELPREILTQATSEAFWEGLTQELAGLMALHHSEDIVVFGQKSSLLTERLADLYQVYLFPQTSHGQIGYESAYGAALLAAGLEQKGRAAEVVEHLRIRQAERVALAPNF
jgi:predicted butyrate kinase (DUF1464 family)